MQVTIWHNPRCSKSRETLRLLQEQGIEPTVRLSGCWIFSDAGDRVWNRWPFC